MRRARFGGPSLPFHETTMTATIRVKSPISDDNPLGFVVINRADFDPAVHELADGEDLGALPDHVPTMAELLAARDALQRRERELDERETGLNQAAAEAQCLADETFAAAAPAAVAKPSKAAK